MRSLPLLFALLTSTAVLAQSKAPDEEWVSPFSADAGTSPPPARAPAPTWNSPPPAPVAPVSPPPPAPTVVAPSMRVIAPPKPPPEEFNTVSVYGAPALGQWKRGLGIYMGFPLLGAKFALGLTDHIDAGVMFDSMYGVMNDFRLHLKWQLVDRKNWTAAFVADGGYALFASSPQAEGSGPRWLTGRRNWNLNPGLLISYRGDSPHSPRLFLDSRCAIAFDTQPYEVDPLSGVPGSVQTSANFTSRAGAEMPFSAKTSFLFMFGFDIHGRSTDSPFMVDVSVGIVTSI